MAHLSSHIEVGIWMTLNEVGGGEFWISEGTRRLKSLRETNRLVFD